MSQFDLKEFRIAYYTVTGKRVVVRETGEYSYYGIKQRIFGTVFECQQYWKRCEAAKLSTKRKTKKLRQIYWHAARQRILGK